MEIRKAFKETIQKSKLIGRRYTDKDRLNGSFGHKWCEFFQNGLFNILEKAGGKSEFDYLGMMRVNNGEFEYWIGMLFAPDKIAPEGFEYIDIETFDAGICWIYGNPDNGEIYGLDAHNKCLNLLDERGWKRKEDAWCIERYNCPRFTTPDEKGNVILDYYIEIE